MGDGSGKATEISLRDGFGEIVVNANGVRVEVHTDKSVDAYTRGAVKVHSPANDSAAAKPASKIGDEMTDGTGIAINGLAG